MGTPIHGVPPNSTASAGVKPVKSKGRSTASQSTGVEPLEIDQLIQIAMRSGLTSEIRHIDNRPGAAMYVRDADKFARYVPAGATVLDWGCGFGQMSWLLDRRGYSVVACERERSPRLPDFLAGAQYLTLDHPVRLPLGTHSVDAILSSGTLEHAALIHDSMRELRRILKPDGRLVIFRFPNQYSLSELIARRSGRWWHAIKMTKAELRYLLRTFSFRVDELGYDTWLPIYLGQTLKGLRGPWAKMDVPRTLVDGVLTRTPGINLLSTSIHAMARVNDEYGAQALDGINTPRSVQTERM